MAISPQHFDAAAVSECPVSTRGRATALAATLMLLMALTGIGLSLVPVVADHLRTDFGFSDSQIGLLTSVFMLALGAVAIPWGLASARWGGKTLTFGLVLGVMGSLLFAWSGSYGMFLVARVVQGAGLGVIVPAVGTIIPDAISPRFRGRAWGVFGMGHGLGVVLALLILPGISAAGGYRAVFGATAGLIVIFALAALSQRAIRGGPSSCADAIGPRELVRALGSTLANRQILLLCLFNMAALAVGVSALVWTPLFLRDEFGAGLGVSAYLTAGLGLAQLIGNPLGALAMGHWSKKTVIVTSMLLLTLCIALVPLLPGLWVVFIFVTLAGLLTMSYFSPIFAGIAEVAGSPAGVGAATGLLEVFGFVGALVAPWLFGLLLDVAGGQNGYLAGYLMLAAIAALSSLGLPFLRLRPTADDVATPSLLTDQEIVVEGEGS